ncbi:hypothetical protein QR680_010225 [Steinernema hermaphroditum]|uniref:Uncharacterized protein n=1 Tax=Steinernema hermaphroditum TaxID=289476 RepID=A0AA39IPG6_9BILA|nr:hypothetical protein QR680_010225 [Steinernema hermaphroditum]
MEKVVVLTEFAFVIIISFLTLFLQMLIFRRRSLKAIWNQSPALSLFLGSVVVMALQSIALASEWGLFVLGFIENVPENTLLLVFIGHFGMVLWQFHYCATIALFAQRVFHLLFPLKNVRNFNHTVLVILSAVFLTGATGLTYSVVVNTKANVKPAPEGCLVFSCMSSNGVSVRKWSSSLVVFMTSVITVLGTYMIFLLHKHRNRKTSAMDRKTNTFVTYVFYVRFACITVPFVVDVTLSNTAHIDMGKYIGPFGAVGGVLDFSLKILAYYVLTRSPTKVMQAVSTTT